MGLILEISGCEAVDVLYKFEVIWAEEAKSAAAAHVLKELFLLCKRRKGTQRVCKQFCSFPCPTEVP